ncbi:sulfatase-like hydrolase/transferase [Pseudomonas sp. MYb185]|uniref:sulfatase-like hydrolase/transferase n=1 Tax=Pseudomonas sp. MYb185 TaxID=1848729 RepID=UPI000CFD5F6D|nr:sulfatase-like hydrolase/transferase [Pseudomonas sp. MYb185]PRB84452.1 hypothetical protein CQ007_01345 [Pseudomonas sp. MYb185]
MVLICLALINAGFLVFSWWFDLARPILNIDYALALLLIALGWRWAGGLLTVMFQLVDMLVLVAQVLPFPRVADLLYLLSFAPMASASLLGLLAIALSLVASKFVTFVWLGQKVTFKSGLLVFNLLLLMLYLGSIDGRQTGTTYRHAEGGIVASQTATFLSMRSDLFIEYYSGESPQLQQRSPGASGPWFDELAHGQLAPRLLLVVVESWGAPHDPAIQKALLAPLQKLPLEFWEQGTLNIVGNTLDGELRELCKLHSSRYNLTDIKEGFEGCLPNKLQKSGYATAAVHGATGIMYDRHQWYPRVGFQQKTFFESRAWPRRCFSFPGACDQDIAEEVETYFSADGTRFMYWLTLNSHTPYDRRDIHSAEGLDCQDFGVDTHLEVCRNLLLQAQFFADFAKLLGTNAMAGVEVVVVSDHIPVIMNAQERQEHFTDGVIPWVRLATRPANAR